MSILKEKPDYHSWNASELFHFLQNNHIVSEDDEFEDWMHDRPDMIKMAEEFFEE
jgi:hypothetical protein